MKITLYSYCPNCGSKRLKQVTQQLQKCSACDTSHYFNQRPCVGALIVQNKKMLLAKRTAMPYKGWWDIPGGFMDIDETPQEAISREVKEELGLHIEIQRFINFYPDTYNYKGVIVPLLSIYFSCGLKGNQKIELSDELNAYNWFPLHDLPPNIAFKNARQAIEDYLEGKFF